MNMSCAAALPFLESFQSPLEVCLPGLPRPCFCGLGHGMACPAFRQASHGQDRHLIPSLARRIGRLTALAATNPEVVFVIGGPGSGKGHPNVRKWHLAS